MNSLVICLIVGLVIGIVLTLVFKFAMKEDFLPSLATGVGGGLGMAVMTSVLIDFYKSQNYELFKWVLIVWLGLSAIYGLCYAICYGPTILGFIWGFAKICSIISLSILIAPAFMSESEGNNNSLLKEDEDEYLWGPKDYAPHLEDPDQWENPDLYDNY